MKKVHVITHNKEIKIVCTTGAEAAQAKLEELVGSYNIMKNFQVPESDKWEVLEVPCD